MPIALPIPEPEVPAAPEEVEEKVPPIGTLDYIYYFSKIEGHLPTPIEVSITGSIPYKCPELKWYNFDIYPHKIKLTNTGYTVLLGAKWRTERPYLEGGPLYEKHVLSQIHFHWGPNFMKGSEHSVDKRLHPGEMQATFFRSEYLTQEEALKHHDGVVMVCYIIKYGVNADERLECILEGFPRIIEAKTNTRIGPYPMSRIMPMFYEDYFLYWGTLTTVKGENHVIRWLVPRVILYASTEQMEQFRKLWDPWDNPNMGNFRPLQDVADRHVFFINAHWNQYNSLLPIPRVPEQSISVPSPAYQANPWMLPPQNRVSVSNEATENKKDNNKEITENKGNKGNK
ncbi:PREDICTED: carbonic anhydrase 3-like [Papilio polytes]|uniref:carbonic anhydrase 3-like n=1 Tax=Papilio polytes TaxID=76194 RepID=UPI00067645CF|nr:PREDICTED: carbonic anhydrase 3-like [Papilio polytes]